MQVTYISKRDSENRNCLAADVWCVAMSGPSLFVVDPFGLQPELEQGENQNHQEENPAKCRGIPHFKELEGLLEQVITEDPGGIGRSTFGTDVHRGKHLQRTDDRQHGNKEDGWG